MHCCFAAQVGSAISIKVPMKNPLQEAVQMAVQYSLPDELIGPAAFSMPVSAQPSTLEFFYAPLRPGKSSASVLIVNDEVRGGDKSGIKADNSFWLGPSCFVFVSCMKCALGRGHLVVA